MQNSLGPQRITFHFRRPTEKEYIISGDKRLSSGRICRTIFCQRSPGGPSEFWRYARIANQLDSHFTGSLNWIAESIHWLQLVHQRRPFFFFLSLAGELFTYFLLLLLYFGQAPGVIPIARPTKQGSILDKTREEKHTAANEKGILATVLIIDVAILQLWHCCLHAPANTQHY